MLCYSVTIKSSCHLNLRLVTMSKCITFLQNKCYLLNERFVLSVNVNRLIKHIIKQERKIGPLWKWEVNINKLHNLILHFDAILWLHLTIRETIGVCSIEFISVVSVPSSQPENSSIIWTWEWNSSDLKKLILQNHLSVCFITDETTRLFTTSINLWVSMCSWIYLANPKCNHALMMCTKITPNEQRRILIFHVLSYLLYPVLLFW